MTAELLAKLGAEELESVQDQIRKAHEELPAEKCMTWRHKQKHRGKEGGCDIHKAEQ